MEKKLVSYSLIIKGRVQGVAFRWYTMKKAFEYDIKGFVKNRMDGSVEVFIEGEEDNANSLINWCRTGPSAAVVEDVDVKENEYKNLYEKFEIQYQ